MLYELDERDVTGIHEVDGMHVEIAEQSQVLVSLIQKNAPYAEIHEAYLSLQQELFKHFEREESILAQLVENDEIHAHYRRHKDNHDRFRELLAYADKQFELGSSTGQVPNVAPLIPQEYFEELKDVDAEMSTLLAKYKYKDQSAASVETP
jgi:hemerythrin